MTVIDKFQQELEAYFEELPEYEKCIDYIDKSSRMLARSIFIRAKYDDNFLKKIFKIGMSTENTLLTECFKVNTILKLEQTSIMPKNEILINNIRHQLPRELSLNKMQNVVYKCNNLYRALRDKGFHYDKRDPKNQFKYLVTGTAELEIDFGVEASAVLNDDYITVSRIDIDVEETFMSIIRPNIFQIIYAKFKRKQPSTKYMIELAIEYEI